MNSPIPLHLQTIAITTIKRNTCLFIRLKKEQKASFINHFRGDGGMKGLLTNFRMGRHTKSENQMILTVQGVADRAKATALIGKKVIWRSPAGKEIRGEVTHLHGTKGAVRVHFLTGMPGQAIGQDAEVQ